jgi:hypothetical protein
MRRRDFVTGIAGSAAAWPLAAHAQRPGKLPTIGYLGSGTAATQGQWTAALMSRLRDLGWIEGRTIAIEYRWAEGRSERFADIAAELVSTKSMSSLQREHRRCSRQSRRHRLFRSFFRWLEIRSATASLPASRGRVAT